MTPRKQLKKKPTRTKPKQRAGRSLELWNHKAEQLAAQILLTAMTIPELVEGRLQAPQLSMSVRLVDERTMKQLNSGYRKKNYATDVLSFPAPPFFKDHGALGDIVVCLPVLQRQAREMKHPAERELEILIVHGVLHLLGFDHEEDDREAAEMRAWEGKLLQMAFGRDSKGLIERVS